MLRQVLSNLDTIEKYWNISRKQHFQYPQEVLIFVARRKKPSETDRILHSTLTAEQLCISVK